MKLYTNTWHGTGVLDEHGNSVGTLVQPERDEVIRRVNVHEEMLAALLLAHQTLGDWEPKQLKAYGLDAVAEKVCAAIVKAEGQS